MWSFANRLPVSQSEVIPTLENYLTFFSNQVRLLLFLMCTLFVLFCEISLLNVFTCEPEQELVAQYIWVIDQA